MMKGSCQAPLLYRSLITADMHYSCISPDWNEIIILKFNLITINDEVIAVTLKYNEEWRDDRQKLGAVAVSFITNMPQGEPSSGGTTLVGTETGATLESNYSPLSIIQRKSLHSFRHQLFRSPTSSSSLWTATISAGGRQLCTTAQLTLYNMALATSRLWAWFPGNA